MSDKKQMYNSRGEKIVITTFEFPVKPEPEPFWKYIFDYKKGTVLGRNKTNWAKLFIFYTIFYIVLAALCAICMQGLLSTLSEEYPRWQLEQSIIGTNPGLSYRPLLDSESADSIIRYKATSDTDVSKLVNSLNEFLESYRNNTKPAERKRVPCDFDKPPRVGEVCKFEIDHGGSDCADSSSFGFDKSKPCLILKLNRIYGWIPQYYNDVTDLHPDMPDDLVEHIRSRNQTQRDQIWISCKGRKNDTVDGIQYVGNRGFPGYFYPFLNQEGYQSPLVTIQISVKPNQIEDNNIVQIECRAWAKNIIYNGSLRERQGSILLELAIAK